MKDMLVREKGVSFSSQDAVAALQSSELSCDLSASSEVQKTAQPVRPSRSYMTFGKRLVDLALVLAVLPFVFPIIAFCAVGLWIESGLPFYRQARLGRDGRVFSIVKLRTMVRNADAQLNAYLQADPLLKAEWDATQKLKRDPRITPVGRFLRVTSLDELPQIWNVLKGEMSIVGPRPMMPDQLEMYGSPDAYFTMRPGITGRWQVSARNESGFAVRQGMDRDYLSNLSLREDLEILKRTVGVVLRGTGY